MSIDLKLECHQKYFVTRQKLLDRINFHIHLYSNNIVDDVSQRFRN